MYYGCYCQGEGLCYTYVDGRVSADKTMGTESEWAAIRKVVSMVLVAWNFPN